MINMFLCIVNTKFLFSLVAFVLVASIELFIVARFFLINSLISIESLLFVYWLR